MGVQSGAGRGFERRKLVCEWPEAYLCGQGADKGNALAAELGERLREKLVGHESAEQITLFTSLGLAASPTFT